MLSFFGLYAGTKAGGANDASPPSIIALAPRNDCACAKVPTALIPCAKLMKPLSIAPLAGVAVIGRKQVNVFIQVQSRLYRCFSIHADLFAF